MIAADASAVTAALIDLGPDGQWARAVIAQQRLAAPHLMPAEVANVLRRAVRTRSVSDDVASTALDDLLSLPQTLVSYHNCSSRIWSLRHNLTAYDAWYVAVAEAYDCPLATLDRRLARAAGPRCRFLVPG